MSVSASRRVWRSPVARSQLRTPLLLLLLALRCLRALTLLQFPHLLPQRGQPRLLFLSKSSAFLLDCGALASHLHL